MSIASAVAEWFVANSRDLPWRRAGFSAWGTLVSEIMLQQTPVSRVIPRLEEWLRRWPDPAALAAVPSGEAVRAWDRLGYPRRALYLHAAAVAIVERHGGVVPRDVSELLALPGIGDYTARAVAVFAYGDRHPVVDTNVRRVIARAIDGDAEAGPPSVRRDLAAMDTLLPTDLVKPIQKKFDGSDRQVRGLLLAELRASDVPVQASELDLLWADDSQRSRCLAGLLADGLVVGSAETGYELPS